MPITGATKIFPIIGYPVAGVFSPPAFNRYFAGHGIDAVMVGFDIAPAGLDGFWAMLRQSPNLLGCSITYPHKQASFLATNDMTDRAARLGALNTIRREQDGQLTGEATDGVAMVSAIRKAGFEPSGKTAHVVGAGGGAGLAIIDCLCENGIASLIIEEIDEGRRDKLHRLLHTHWPDVRIVDTQPADILVNATTLGKSANDTLPFSRDAIAQASLCCDVVTSASDTQFVAAAKHAGKAVLDGSDMGAEQIEAQLAFIGLRR